MRQACRRILIALLTSFYACFVPFAAVRAANVDLLNGSCSSAEARKTEFCKTNLPQEDNKNVVFGDKSILYKVIQTIIFLTGMISVIIIIIGGFKYVTSGGDANSTKSAKDTILYAVVGLVIAVFCQAIVSFVLSRFI